MDANETPAAETLTDEAIRDLLARCEERSEFIMVGWCHAALKGHHEGLRMVRNALRDGR